MLLSLLAGVALTLLVTPIFSRAPQPNASLAASVATLNNKIDLLGQKLNALRSTGGSADMVAPDESAETPDTTDKLHSLDDANRLLAPLKDQARADALSQALVELDNWLVGPEDEAKFRALKLDLAERLRHKVVDEVADLQRQALAAPTGQEGVRLQNEAARVVALYPLSDDPKVTAEARDLSTR